MLTFEGKTFSYYKNKAKDPPNKEASPNRFLLEKLYRVHRIRVLNAKSAVETHVHIPDFMKNALSAKEVAKEHQQLRVVRENETIYRRIAKAENTESMITKDAREHVRRVEHELVLMERLKKMGRARGILRTNRENEDILLRIERARPEYSMKAMKEWYKYHELFKKGRKSDPTAGHLGFRNMKGLMPTSLPPVNFDTTLEGGQRSNVDLAMERARNLATQREGLTLQALNSPNGPSSLDSPASSSSPFASPANSRSKRLSPVVDKRNIMSHVDMTSNRSLEQPQSSPAGKLSLDTDLIRSGEPSTGHHSHQSRGSAVGTPLSGISTGRSQQSSRSNGKRAGKKTKRGNAKSRESEISSIDGGKYGLPSTPELSLALLKSSEHMDDVEDEFSVAIDVDPDYIVLLSKLCSIPFEDTSVIMQMLVAHTYEECIMVRVHNNLVPHEILVEREVDIDDAFEILNNFGSMMLNSESVNLKSLRGQLIGLFQELDSDKSGYLSFDEFSELMARSQVGIQNEDLRSVLASADENGDGVVQFSEFVPLAIDMILAFRAKSEAVKWVKQKDSKLDEEVLRQMKRMDIAMIVDAVLMKISESDPKKTGSVRMSDLRRHLTQIAAKVGLMEVEIAWVLRHSSKVGMGRCRYDNIGELLTRSRFLVLKHGLLEETGSDVLKYLLQLCNHMQIEDEKLCAPDEYGFIPGLLNRHMLSKALLANDRYPVTMMQISVLLGDDSAGGGHAHEGKIDYYSILPVVAKSIEILRDPKTLRQRAELIDPLGVSLDSSSILAEKDQERQTTSGSASSPVAVASTSPSRRSSTAISASNTPSTPNGRKSILMKDDGKSSSPTSPSASRGTSMTPTANSRLSGITKPSQMSSFERRLRALFTSSDLDKNGSLNQTEFVSALRALDLHLSNDETIALKEQADYDHNGEVSFAEFCTFFANNLASLERMKHMRAMHMTLHAGEDEYNEAQSDNSRIAKELSEHLLSVFGLSDPDRTGKVHLSEMERIISSLDVEISDFHISSMLSEAHLDSGGLVNYVATVSILVDLLMSFLSQQNATAAESDFVKEASQRAHEVTLGSSVEIFFIVSYIYRGLLAIEQEYDETDLDGQNEALVNMLNSPHSGLAQSESTFLILRLFSSSQEKYKSPSRVAGLAMLNVPESLQHELEHRSKEDRIKHMDRQKHRAVYHSHAHAPSAVGPVQMVQSRRSTYAMAAKSQGNRTHNTVKNDHDGTHNSVHGVTGLRRGTYSGPSDKMKSMHSQDSPKRLLQEITDAVFDARKLTVQRGILQSMPLKAIEKLLYTALVHSRDVLALQGTCPHNSIYIPIRECFAILEESRHFRLTRTQIMGLVSWAECHDPTNKLIDFAAFSTYAAQMIKSLNNPKMQESRAQLVRMMCVIPASRANSPRTDVNCNASNGFHRGSELVNTDHIANAALNGLSESELDAYLLEAFTSVQSADETVDVEVFVDIIMRIPRIKLNAKEANTVAAAFPRTANGTLYWPEFIPFAHTTFASLCLERLLSRRMMLGGGSDAGKVMMARSRPRNPPPTDFNATAISNTDSLEEVIEGDMGQERSVEAIAALRKLATGIIDHVEVRVSSRDSLVILLPGESIEEEEEMDDDAIKQDDHSVSSLESLESFALEQLSSPTIKAILQRRKPNELRLQLDEVDEEGTHHVIEEHFEDSNTGVTGVTLFDSTVTMSVLVVKVGAGAGGVRTSLTLPQTQSTRSSGIGGIGSPGGNAPGPNGNNKTSPGPSPGPSPVLQRRKTFVAPREMAEPANSRSMPVRLSVLCAESEVLAFDRSLIVTAGRTSTGAVINPQGKTVPVPPFDIVCLQTVRLPSICLVDATAAGEFASSLHEQLYLEVAENGIALALKMKDMEYYTH